MKVSPNQNTNYGVASWIFEEAQSIGSRVWSAVSRMIWTPPRSQEQKPSEDFVLVNNDRMNSFVSLAPSPPQDRPDENGLVFHLAPPQIRNGVYSEEGYEGPLVNKQFAKDAFRAIDNRLIYIDGKPCSINSANDLKAIAERIFQACTKKTKLFKDVTEILNQRILLDLKHKIQEHVKSRLQLKDGSMPMLMERDIERFDTYYNTEKPTQVIVHSIGTVRWIMNDTEIESIAPLKYTAEATHDLGYELTTYRILIQEESSPDEAKLS